MVFQQSPSSTRRFRAFRRRVLHMAMVHNTASHQPRARLSVALLSEPHTARHDHVSPQLCILIMHHTDTDIQQYLSLRHSNVRMHCANPPTLYHGERPLSSRRRRPAPHIRRFRALWQWYRWCDDGQTQDTAMLDHSRWLPDGDSRYCVAVADRYFIVYRC